MARDRSLDDQAERDEELLDFDLDDLSFSEGSDEDMETEEEIIELSDLIERGSSEDITRDLKAPEWSSQDLKNEQARQGNAPVEEAGLDFSDISLEMDTGPLGEKTEDTFLAEEITEDDLEGLLQEEEDLTLDLTEEDESGIEDKLRDEITEADLQALLSESAEQDFEGEEQESSLDMVGDEKTADMDTEPLDETQLLNLNAAGEESFVEEDPASILAREIEELGVAELAAEGGAPDEAETPEDMEESASLPAVAADRVRAEEDEPSAEEPPAGISEARVEEIIREVVGEVVERVARETMTDVAERMIGEAIESLKRQLESSDS